MKKPDLTKLPEGPLRRYDWAKAVRGRFVAKAAKASALLRILHPRLAARFPDSKSVNEALRALLVLDRALTRRPARKRRAA